MPVFQRVGDLQASPQNHLPQGQTYQVLVVFLFFVVFSSKEKQRFSFRSLYDASQLCKSNLNQGIVFPLVYNLPKTQIPLKIPELAALQCLFAYHPFSKRKEISEEDDDMDEEDDDENEEDEGSDEEGDEEEVGGNHFPPDRYLDLCDLIGGPTKVIPLVSTTKKNEDE